MNERIPMKPVSNVLSLFTARKARKKELDFQQMSIVHHLGMAADRDNEFKQDAIPVANALFDGQFSMEYVIKVADFLDIPTENIPALQAYLSAVDDRLYQERFKR
ncbi:hypothetical protein [Sinorhizobium sp. BG8]|uniref:hypothetical protein n=1 Tax=Sinorhizobium sp. BG8 TaxID=2613773 RepID=UPI00193DC496|nr:hypothetical protein [Sinorhizobium sp. BG8]QRM55159.1 hypothetical protein F3Y30_11895 [Sinorhizobium sp. BG8]